MKTDKPDTEALCLIAIISHPYLALDGWAVRFEHLLAGSALCRGMYRLPDALICSAPADIGDGGIDIAIGWAWDPGEQRRGGHDHAALTVTALRNLARDPGHLNRVRPVFRHALDGDDLSALDGRHWNRA